MLTAAPGGWDSLAKLPAANGLKSDLVLDRYAAYTLTAKSMANSLSYAPAENTKYGFGRGSNSRLISVPTPDGTYARFRIVETTTSMMDPKLAAKFTAITTYAGVGVDDPSASIRLDYTPLGFHAQVLTTQGKGAYYVEPYFHNNTAVYASYYKADAEPGKGTAAEAAGEPSAGKASDVKSAPLKTASAAASVVAADRTSGTQLRTYRTAVAATGEYTAFFGGTVTAGQSAIVSAINRVSGVYETELSIRLSLVANNSSLVYTNASTDPYTNNNGSTMLGQNITNVNNVIGSANYDIGHVFSTGGGGVAYLGVVGGTSKAGGVTGSPAPTGDAFWIDYVAHEMGHQFGANHTFNTSQDGNRNAGTAVEPGSGSTIMGYAGIEGTEDLQPNSDPYFSFISVNEILTYVDGSIPNVGVRTATGNSIPTVTTGTMAYTIPANTPFTLTSPAASDANGDTVYYSWEEADIGTADQLNGAGTTTGALFRTYNPTTDPSRTFPRLATVLAGQTRTQALNSGYYAERLPTTSRAMKFVLTLRDQRAGGGGTNVLSGAGNGTTSGTITPTATVTSVAAASTFAVSNFNTATTIAGGSQQTITWNVAGTTGNGINTSQVNLLMSTDGGQTFATTLAAATANDGSETVTIPNVASSLVRFKVAAVGNIYFDINNANLTVTQTAVTPSATPGVPDLDAASDSGVSNSDNVTNRNNNGPTKALQFAVSGTVSGATVNVLSDNVVIGTATATGTSTVVTTNGTAFINDGTHTITATQTEPGKTTGAASAALTVLVDTVAPTVTASSFTFVGNSGPTVAFNTSEPIGSLTLPQFFSAGNTTTGNAVPTANLVTGFNGTTASLSFNGVSGAPSATTLTNGNYTANLNAGGLTDVAGNALATTASTSFYWLNGDANRDRRVDFNDFLVLQNNFGTSQLDFSKGDFNYDGKVDFNDFLILQNNFGLTV